MADAEAEAETAAEAEAEPEELEGPPPGGWESWEARADFLAKCSRDAESRRPDEEVEAADIDGVGLKKRIEDRMDALKLLRKLSRWQDNADALATDPEIRAAAVFCASPPDERAARAIFAEKFEESTPAERSVAISVLINFMASASARPILAADPQVRHALVVAADSEEQARELCAKAAIALAELPLSGACPTAWDPNAERPTRAVATEEDPNADMEEPLVGSSEPELCAALLCTAALGEPPRQRAAALGALWSLAATDHADRRAMWASSAVRQVAVTGAAVSEQYEVRESAIGLLWSLAVAEDNRLAMWADMDVRAALRDGVAAQRPAVDQTSATQPSSRQSHCFDDPIPLEIRPSLKGMPPPTPEGPSQPIEVRAKALGALATLAQADANRRSMWADRKLARHLLEATCVTPALAKQLRLPANPATGPGLSATVYSAALRVLVILSKHDGNREEMCRAMLPDILAVAAEDKALPWKQRRDIETARTRLLAKDEDKEHATTADA